MSIIKHKEQRVGVFIDAQNLYHSAKNLYKRKVNFGAILKDALAGRRTQQSRHRNKSQRLASVFWRSQKRGLGCWTGS